jgi:iron complex transport system permease protein
LYTLNQKLVYLIFIGLVGLVASAILNLMAGSADISLVEIYKVLTNSNSLASNENSLLLYEIRIPKTITALFAGALLAQCGLIMQSYFQNPLAGPYVLGISGGASFGAAIFMMTPLALWFPSLASFGIVGFAFIGAALVTLLILGISLRNNHITIVLIIGLLINYFVSSLQSIVEYFASANDLKNFNTWSFGNLNSVGLTQLNFLIPILFVLTLSYLSLSKSLNLLAVGRTNAIALGLNYKRFSMFIIILTALTTAVVTAYCGPISFVGMIVPFSIRWWTKSNHHFLLLIASGIYGAILLLTCDFISYKLIPQQYIPINIILGILGIPFIIIYLTKHKSFQRL